MENIVEVRGVRIGEGIPKICVPIVGKTKEEVLALAEQLKTVKHDLVEWRVDWLVNSLEFANIADILIDLRAVLKDTPLLFTFRTGQEGGETEIDKETYLRINAQAVATGLIDLVDLELFMGDDLVESIIKDAHDFGVKVVVSSHDFERTPARKEIITRLQRMQNIGADIAKLAVMPESKADVITLLSATEEMASTYAAIPIVTMSMEKTGVISRICGEYFGSAITFGSASLASAPGQIPADDLFDIMKKMHEFL